MPLAWSNSKHAQSVKALCQRLASEQGGAAAVEYVLAIAVIVVAMAAALDVLFGDLQTAFGNLSKEVAKPYP